MCYTYNIANIKPLKYCIPFPNGSLKTQIGSWVLLSIKIYLFAEAYSTNLQIACTRILKSLVRRFELNKLTIRFQLIFFPTTTTIFFWVHGA